MRAFIECEAGSDLKKRYDEASLELKKTMRLRAAYPFAYGFLMGIAGGDGDCLDCFLLSSRGARSGEQLECEAIGMIRFFEGEEIDDKILVTRVGEPRVASEADYDAICAFLREVFKAFPEVSVAFGPLGGPREAAERLQAGRA